MINCRIVSDYDRAVCSSGFPLRAIAATLATREQSLRLFPSSVYSAVAFAWRNPKGEPSDQPDPGEELEFVLLRLSDGAVLAKSATEYWATGEMRVNRLTELATWSPDSTSGLS